MERRGGLGSCSKKKDQAVMGGLGQSGSMCQIWKTRPSRILQDAQMLFNLHGQYV